MLQLKIFCFEGFLKDCDKKEGRRGLQSLSPSKAKIYFSSTIMSCCPKLKHGTRLTASERLIRWDSIYTGATALKTIFELHETAFGRKSQDIISHNGKVGHYQMLNSDCKIVSTSSTGQHPSSPSIQIESKAGRRDRRGPWKTVFQRHQRLVCCIFPKVLNWPPIKKMQQPYDTLKRMYLWSRVASDFCMTVAYSQSSTAEHERLSWTRL